MHPQLTWPVVEARTEAATRAAALPGRHGDHEVRARPWWRALVRRKEVSGAERRRPHARAAGGITIRYAFPDDREDLARLAALDSQAVPGGPLLVAEVDGELWAALALTGPAAMSDPFRPSAELLLLLAERSRQLRGTTARRRDARPRRVASLHWRTS